MKINQIIHEGYRKVAPIDRERYTDLPGLEGPFTLRNGKVVYYDPKEGKYYDRDTDMYIDHEDYFAMDKDPDIREADQVKAKERKPKKVKPTKGGSSPHPYRGRLVGEGGAMPPDHMTASTKRSRKRSEQAKKRRGVEESPMVTRGKGQLQQMIKSLMDEYLDQDHTTEELAIILKLLGKKLDMKGERAVIDTIKQHTADVTQEDFQMKLSSASADDYVSDKKKKIITDPKELRKKLVKIGDRYNVNIVDDYEDYVYNKGKTKTDGAQSPLSKSPRK